MVHAVVVQLNIALLAAIQNADIKMAFHWAKNPDREVGGQVRDVEMAKWFGPDEPIGDMDTKEACGELRAIGDETGADELAAATAKGTADTYAVGDLFRKLFNRFVKTTNICGFLRARGADTIVPVTSAPASGELRGKPLKITLDGLRITRYPGAGRHSILFDFALQGQEQQGLKDQLFHFDAHFQATDGETVPVREGHCFWASLPLPRESPSDSRR